MTKRERVLEKANYRCYYCNGVLNMLVGIQDPSYPCVVNYIQGLSGEANLVACCRACSRIKQNLDTKEAPIAAVRKWINKEKYRLGYDYNKEWMESDADNIGPRKYVGRPSLDEIVVDATLSRSPHAQRVGGEIENETKEDEEWIVSEAKRLAEKYGKNDAQRVLDVKFGVANPNTLMTEGQMEEFVNRGQHENIKRVEVQSKAILERLKTLDAVETEGGGSVVERPKVVGKNIEFDALLDD